MLRNVTVLLVLPPMLAAGSTAFATSYYVDSVWGSDSNSGTSTSSAWRTLTRASSQAYDPGDQILLKRGCVWQGAPFTSTRSGAADNPILLADYGTGALPQIIGSNGSEADSALVLQNVSYWTVRNLDLTQVGNQPPIPPNSDASHSDEWLKYVFLIRGLNGGTAAHIRVENCLVHGATGVVGTTDPLGANGLFIMAGYYQSDSGNTGYVDDVVVDGCELYGNFKAGGEVSCRYTKAITYTATNVQFLNCLAHDNGGHGIVMGPTQYSLIDNCVAYQNGNIYNARVGLWFWDAQYCVTQNSESYGNVVPPAYVGQSSARDGAGFDLDLGTMDCVMQYNYSHDNMGEGYLLMEWPIGYGYSRGYTMRITMRYCISEHDATDHGAPVRMSSTQKADVSAAVGGGSRDFLPPPSATTSSSATRARARTPMLSATWFTMMPAPSTSTTTATTPSARRSSSTGRAPRAGPSGRRRDAICTAWLPTRSLPAPLAAATWPMTFSQVHPAGTPAPR